MPMARKSSVDPSRRPLTKAHIPYRADDFTHGKKTGVTVREVDRRSDGFEPFGEILTQADGLTPPNAGTRRKRRSASIIPEEDENVEVSMILDNSTIASPNIYFNNAPRPSVPTSANRTILSNRSSNRSSIVNYDDIPAPRVSSLQRARVPVNGSVVFTPRHKSRLSQTTVVPSSPDSSDDDNGGSFEGNTYDDYGNEFNGADGGDDGFQYNQEDDQPPEGSSSPQEAKTSFSALNEATSDLPAPEMPPISSPVRKRKNEKSKMSIAEEQVEMEEDDGHQLEENDGMVVDEGIELEEEEPETRSRRATASENPKPKKAPAKRKKVQMADIIVDHDPVPDGVRRSGRKPMKPLKWWMGERVVYGRRETGVTMVPVIKDVIRIPQEDPEPLRYKKSGGRQKPRSRSKSAAPKANDNEDADLQGLNPEEGWDDSTDPVGVVLDFVSGKEIQRRLALPSKLIKPELSVSKEFQYQKIFGDGDFIAAGYIILPVGGKKPSKGSRDNAYVFYVVEGALQYKVHRTSFVIATGGTFIVPRGNTYYLENIASRPTKLFFAQARKVQIENLDETREDGVRSRSAGLSGRSSSVAVPNRQSNGSKRAVSK